MARVLEREAHVGRDVRRLPVLQRDRVRHGLPDVARVVRGLAGLAHRDLDEVELEEGHEVPGRRRRVDRPFVSVLEQGGDEPGVVQVGVGDDDRIERTERQDLGRVQVRRSVVLRDQDAAVDQDLRLPGTQEGGGAANLPESAERRDPHVVLPLRDLPREAPADLLQERLPLVVNRPKVLPDLLDRLRRDRRGPHDLGRPADLLLDLIQDGAVAADDDAGGESLDRDLPGLRLEVYPGDLRFGEDHLADHLLRLVLGGEERRIRSDDDPAPQLLRDLSHEVVRLCEDLHVLRVDHDRGAFEVDLRDFHVVRYHFLHDASRVVQNVLDGHRTSLWPEVASDSGQFHTRFALLDFFVVEHLEAVFRNEGHVDPFARDRVALHGGGHRADRQVRPLFERHVVLPVVFQDPVYVGTPGTAGHEFVREGSTRCVEGVDVASCTVPAADHELDPIGVEPASTQDVRGKGRTGLDGHRDAALQLVQLDLRGDVAGEDLQISDQAGRRQAEIVVQSIDFLRSLVGDQCPGGRSAIRREHHAVLANEPPRRRSGLDFLGNRYHSYTPVQKGVTNDSRRIRPALFTNDDLSPSAGTVFSRALPTWRDRGFDMRTRPRIPPNRKQVRNYVVSLMVGAIAGSVGWIVVVRPSLLMATVLLICAPSIVVIVIAISIAAAPKEWRKAMLANPK